MKLNELRDNPGATKKAKRVGRGPGSGTGKMNLGLIQKFIDAGKLDAKGEITEDVLLETGIIRRKLDGVRVLAKGDVTAKLKLSVTGASKSAIEAVEKAGGSLTVATAAAE